MTTKNGCRGGYKAVGQAADEEQDGVGDYGRPVIGRAMKWKRKAVTHYCRLRGGKGIGRCWDDKIGGSQVRNARDVEEGMGKGKRDQVR